ncbi:kelch domain-containing protein [Bisporella sp. PMI_857]|nr:kelch domain-containing protein [Bisporella sp. PMI_857]
MISCTILRAFFIALLIRGSLAITACPTAVTTYTDADGAKYSICLDTDYTGASLLVTQNVASVIACAQICGLNPSCTKAVYDTTSRVCHVKDSTATLTWVSNTRYDTIYLNNINSEGAIIAVCPFSGTNYTYASGTEWHICPNTDYQGASLRVITNIASPTICAQTCAAATGCSKAVFDNVNLVCHIKDTSAMLIWAMNKKFDVIRLKVPNNEAKLGRWSDIIRLPIIPVAGYIVPQVPEPSRILVFSAWGATNFGGAAGYTQFADYNFKTGTASQRQVSNTNHDMFCPGISSLVDGRIVITGGSDAEKTSIYDPVTNSFTRGPNMKIARGYQTSATLSDGQVFTIGGSYSGGYGGKNGEIYNPSTNAWTLLPSASVDAMLTDDHEGIWREDNHGWLFGWTNRSVFQAGPSRKQHWYGTTGSGSVLEAGTRDDDDAMCGVNVMYDVGKILSTGGAPDYDNSAGITRTHITTITTPFQPAVVERVQDMAAPRAYGNGVVLPDGSVLVTGGQKTAHVFTDTDGILAAEIFNPTTKTWTQLALAAVARNYHAISILLPDGTVFSGGGGLCYVGLPGSSDANCNLAVNHADGQIFTPPYLFNADNTLAARPAISSLASHQVAVGGTLTVTMSTTATGVKFSLLRLGSCTHSINSDQRRVPVSNSAQSGTTYVLQLERDSGILIPGYYYLFALSAAGVPSVAKTVQIVL